MPIIELTDDEFATLRDAFDGVGSDCPDIDLDKFEALGVKLGFREAEKSLTEEELKRRQEWANSPAGKQIAELWKTQAEIFYKDYAEDNEFFATPKLLVGSQLRIRLPNDYIKDKK
jgi:hypothetical protein